MNDRSIYEVAYGDDNGIHELTISQAMDKVKEFMINSSQVKITDLGKEYNYEAFNFIMIPTTFECNFLLFDSFKVGDNVIARRIGNYSYSKNPCYSVFHCITMQIYSNKMK